MVAHREEDSMETNGIDAELDRVVSFLRGGVRRPDWSSRSGL